MIWQPFGLYQPGAGFGVHLDRDFANKMVSARISAETQNSLRDLLKQTSRDRGFSYSEPVVFYGDTCLVDEFHIGCNGTWLSMELSSRDSLKIDSDGLEPLLYSSHNVDTSREAYTLLALVDKWVSYSDVLLEQRID